MSHRDEYLAAVDDVTAFDFFGVTTHPAAVDEFHFFHIGTGTGFGDGQRDQTGLACALAFSHVTADSVDERQIPGGEAGHKTKIVDKDHIGNAHAGRGEFFNDIGVAR